MAEDITPQAASNESGANNLREETLIFNVGGKKFETYRSTLSRIPNGPLADNTFLEEHFRNGKNDYFFDKDPDAFKVVLNYMRSGNIYIPTCLNGPSFRNELVFWGLTADMESENSANSQTHGYTGTTGHVETGRTGTNREGEGNTTWNTLSNPSFSLWAKLYAGLSYFLMCLSVFLLVFQTTPLFDNPRSSSSSNIANSTYEYDTRVFRDTHIAVYIISFVCCIFFTVEYVLRVMVAPNRLRFIFSFLGAIDILAILPEYLIFLLSLLDNIMTVPTLRSLRILRILSIFRILRMLRVFEHFKNVTRTEFIASMLKTNVGELALLFGVTAISVLSWGTLVHYVEREEIDGKFDTIPRSCWWAVVTMTTVGYGDMFPITVAGQILGSLCAISGLLLIGLLVSVLINTKMLRSRKIQEVELNN